MFDKSELKQFFDKKKKEKQAIIVAGIGSGLTAKAAVAGGADFIATYSTARYRIQGIPTGLAFLPYDNCNEITFSLVPEVLAVSGTTPLFLGLGAHDPRMPVEYLLDRTQSLGVLAVTNEPFIGMYGEVLKDQLDHLGYGVNKEIELIKKGSDRGMLTLGYVFDENEAVQFADAGADILAIMVGGVTSGGSAGGESALSLDDSVRTINQIIEYVQKTHPDIPVLVHGGPLNGVSAVEYALKNSDAAGYVTGSTGERVPAEQGIKAAIEAFCKIERR